MTETDRPTRLARSVAAYGLPGRTPDSIEIPGDMAAALLSKVAGQRLTGLAVAGVEDGAFSFGAEHDERLMSVHREAMIQVVALERTLVRVLGAMADRGVRPVILKGPAVAHRIYPDASWRPFGDLDILVRSEDWREAGAVLESLGMEREVPEPRRGFDERFGKAAVYTDREGLQVDLHRTLVLGPFGLWMEPSELFDVTEPFTVGDRETLRLGDTALFLHACIHAALGSMEPLLLPMRDVAQILALGKIDWDLLERWAGAWRLRPVITHALAATGTALGMPWPLEMRGVASGKVRRRERRAMRAYVTRRRGVGGTARATITAIPGIRAKIAYVWDLLFPSPEFLAARAGTTGRPSRLRRLLVPFRWLKKRRGAS